MPSDKAQPFLDPIHPCRVAFGTVKDSKGYKGPLKIRERWLLVAVTSLSEDLHELEQTAEVDGTVLSTCVGRDVVWPANRTTAHFPED